MDNFRGKILIADDDREILTVLRILLEGEGYQVVSASDGHEVLEKADDSVSAPSSLAALSSSALRE